MGGSVKVAPWAGRTGLGSPVSVRRLRSASSRPPLRRLVWCGPYD
jgi:hypothetical protein